MKKTIFAVFVFIAMALVAQESIPLPLAEAFRDSTELEAGPTQVLTPRYAYFLGVASPQAFANDMPDCWTTCLGVRLERTIELAEYAIFIHVPADQRGEVSHIEVKFPADFVNVATFIVSPSESAKRVLVLVLPDHVASAYSKTPEEVTVYSKEGDRLFSQRFDALQMDFLQKDLKWLFDTFNNPKD